MMTTIKIKRAYESLNGVHPTNEIMILPVCRIKYVQPFGQDSSVISMDWGQIFAAHSADTIAQMMSGTPAVYDPATCRAIAKWAHMARVSAQAVAYIESLGGQTLPTQFRP